MNNLQWYFNYVTILVHCITLYTNTANERINISSDIYHPDFNLGRPAYFNLFIRSTTQSAVISSQAGVAATGGEVAKDTQYQSADGGDFISLVCETFGVWTPYALSIF